MNILHIKVQRGDDPRWLVAQGLEEPGVITQARTLDELVRNVEGAYTALTNRRTVHIELLLPPGLMSGVQGRKPIQSSQRLKRPTKQASLRAAS